MTQKGVNQLIQFSSLFRLLSHPVRLKILYTLNHQSMAVCHLGAILKTKQAYLSQQLSILRESGIVSCRKEGWHKYYYIVDPKIFDILDEAKIFMNLKLDIEQIQLTKIPDCHCPDCQGELEENGFSFVQKSD